MWGARYREEQKEKATIRKRKESRTTEEISVPPKEEDEDLIKHHLKGTLEEKREVEIKTPGAMEKIDNLPIYKRAVIWREILDKPVSER